MAATVQIRRKTGAGPTSTNITSTTNIISTSDDPAPGTNNPIPIPPSASIFSYWVVTRLTSITTPAGTIDNVRWYTDGANGLGTGVTLLAESATSYIQATGSEGVEGDELNQGNYATLANDPSDAFGFTVGAPLAVAGDIDNPDTGDFADFVVYQLEVASTASPGQTPLELITWVYDET